MKVNYTEGRSGFFKEGEKLTKSTAKYSGGFGIITKKGAISYFDSVKDEDVTEGKALEEGMPVFLKKWDSEETNPLKEGDEVQALIQRLSCWTTDCPVAATEGTVDVTSQCDIAKGAKDIRPDGNIQETGTINGYYETESEMQRALEDKFIAHIEDGEGKITYVPRDNTSPLWHFFIARETETVGETEQILIRKMFISGFTTGQGSSGFNAFSFNYSTLEAYNYRRKINANQSA